jgi:hypothetical protein
VAFAAEQTVPLGLAVTRLFPITGLRRGSTVTISARPSQGAHGALGAQGVQGVQGATTLAFAIAATASATGSWCAAAGFPDLGLVAVAELGVALDRLALIPWVTPGQWVTVVGALLDAVDILIVRPPPHLRPGDARRLVTRARERGTVLIPVGRWTESAETRLEVVQAVWEGPGAGNGHLIGRQLHVNVRGRGAASRERTVDLRLDAQPVPIRSAG